MSEDDDKDLSNWIEDRVERERYSERARELVSWIRRSLTEQRRPVTIAVVPLPSTTAHHGADPSHRRRRSDLLQSNPSTVLHLLGTPLTTLKLFLRPSCPITNQRRRSVRISFRLQGSVFEALRVAQTLFLRPLPIDSVSPPPTTCPRNSVNNHRSRSSDHLVRTSFNVADPLESAFDFKVRSLKYSLSPSLCSFGHLRSAIVTTINVLSLKHFVSPSLCSFGLLPICHRHQLQRIVVVEGLSLSTAVLHLVPKPKPSSAYAIFLRQSMCFGCQQV
ncbi:hypothetical protein PIB30_071989 [Stylosanthes scabra]|uniref:Uncharacterized protein n=1 Tax=Stylosanthes scabra TaxID=79078 RepID=A0ABU6WMA9_9FABA|nr:hypothetical protein [Stylosanthes scabra]